jgi:hypothetical protein
MRLKTFLRTLSLGATAGSFLVAGAAWALPASQPASSTETNASWLAGATARLDHGIDAKDARAGEAIEAKLDHAVKTPDGTELPGGTELRGTVASVQAPAAGSSASITLRFDKAALKDGNTVPVKVTVIGAYPYDEGQLSVYGQESMAPAPTRVSAKARYDQKPGTLSHIAMNSRVSGENSATFINTNGDVKLRAGTFLQLGIARQPNGMDSGA